MVEFIIHYKKTKEVIDTGTKAVSTFVQQPQFNVTVLAKANAHYFSGSIATMAAQHM